MRILLLASAYNGLTQRVHIELLQRGHQVSFELALNDTVMLESVQLFQPEIIFCPFLKQRIPAEIWKNYPCIIVHPGIKGDRGPSSLDWVLQEKQQTWGVTALQAAAEMDAGAIWATSNFKVRPVAKSGTYAIEVTEAAVDVVLQTIERFQSAGFVPESLDYSKPDVYGRLRPLMKQSDRRIDWLTDTTAAIIDKINAADGCPGVLDVIGGEEFYLYGACYEDRLRGTPGQLLAQCHGAVCRASVDGALWISLLKSKDGNGSAAHFKLPAAAVLGERAKSLPETVAQLYADGERTFREIWYEEHNAVGYLHFDFYNGAMSTGQCLRLRDAFLEACDRPTKAIVLMGGRSCWSNGVHLNVIEAAPDPAEESWHNINAIDDLIHAILVTTSKITVAAVHGNAGAGGVPLALACDKVYVRTGAVFNPHYKSMGLYGSEYWTYSLTKRVGKAKAVEITDGCKAMGMQEAERIGLIDAKIHGRFERFDGQIKNIAESLAHGGNFQQMLQRKQLCRNRDEFIKPLASYRKAELQRMWENFFAPESIYHSARKQFVFKKAATETPLRLARHRLPMCTRCPGVARGIPMECETFVLKEANRDCDSVQRQNRNFA
jgi:putative two-component system hydrogenase maturation factor HypX/HoxX